jgi:hypothetical protein
MNFNEYIAYIEKIIDADNHEGFYRNATVEEVLEYSNKVMEEVKLIEEFPYTKASVFNFVGQGLLKDVVENCVDGLSLRKVEGELYYDEEDGLLYVLTRAKEVEENSFVTLGGEEFVIESMFDEEGEVK